MKKRKRIAIDLVPIRVGEGGTGSGIWTYARELIHHMDSEDFQGLEIVCLVNDGQLPYLSNLRKVRLVRFPTFGKSIVFRLLWVHLLLPLVCWFRRVDVLHKLATETPLFCSAKRVTTIHDFYYEFLLENHPPETIRLYERLENFYFSLTTRTCFRKSRAIIAVSESTRQEAIQRYPDSAHRVRVIHHGVVPECAVGGIGHEGAQGGGDEYRISNSECRNLKECAVDKQVPASGLQPKVSPFKILCVAKFMEHKGQHLLVAAFERLLLKHPELEGRVGLELRGFHNDADYYEALCDQISKSQFSNAIRRVEFNPKEPLEEIYAAADLVVLLSSYEGFGLPVLEAQGLGIPVLCSDLPVLREVGGDGAAYVARENCVAVADAIDQFVEDSGYYKEMKARAFKNVDRFSWEKAARQTLECYAC